MRRGRVCVLFAAAVIGGGSLSASARFQGEGRAPMVLQQFLAADNAPPFQTSAIRHLIGHSDQFDATGWMRVWTEGDRAGFRFGVLAEGGSGYIRNHVLRSVLESEQKIWAARTPELGALSEDNYTFDDRGLDADGLVRVVIAPRRKDTLLVEGSIFLRPDRADLVRVEGTLTRNPSFWTRKVDIIRRYERIAGVRVPVFIETVASVRLAGRSTFTMTYEYQSINGSVVNPSSAP